MRVHICLIPLIAVLLSTSTIFGQSLKKKSNYKKNPVWIEMMNDPNVNFYETKEAFKVYYKNHVLPEEPKEFGHGDTFESEIGIEEEKEYGNKTKKEIKREKRLDNSDKSRYAAEVRAFKGWYYENLNWLRNDGTIISVAERQEIIDKQKLELLEAEGKREKHYIKEK